MKMVRHFLTKTILDGLIRKSSLRRSIVAALTIMVMPIVVIGGISIWAITSSTDKFTELADDQVDQTILILAARDQLITAEYWAMQYVNEGQRSAKVYYGKFQERIDRNMDRLQIMTWPAARRLVSEIREAWEVARPVGERALRRPPGSSATAAAYPLELFHPAMEEGIGKLGDLNQVNLDYMQSEVAKLSGVKNRMLIVLAVAFLVALAVAATITRMIGRRVNKSLGCREEGARRYAEDDFSHRIEIPREREFVAVAGALNSMAERVSQGKAAEAALQEELRHQALHDPLTGLANRPLLADRVQTALHQVQRTKCTVGVLFLDVDDFKGVNDSYGHAVGDELLNGIARRLHSCLRSSDTAARIGGDEFAVLLQNMGRIEDADVLAHRILEAFSFPFVIGEKEFEVHPSIGIASSADPAISGEELMRRADVAMYNAKRSGKNQAISYVATMDENTLGSATLRMQMRRALERHEFVAFYQPVVDLATGRIQGAEALIRWDHPTQGVLTPDRFLPAAEESGLMHEIDKWMLNQACAQATEWRRNGWSGLSIAVNVSSSTIARDDFAEVIVNTLATAALPAHNLVIEITEEAYVHDAAVEKLAQVKRLGVRVAIDDFGTGYSSLNYLTRFPIDVLKIDKTFIDEVADGPEGGALAKAIVTLADAMNLRTVAEGIEEADQLDALCRFGVESGQGYIFAKPVDAATFADLLETGVDAPLTVTT